MTGKLALAHRAGSDIYRASQLPLVVPHSLPHALSPTLMRPTHIPIAATFALFLIVVCCSGCSGTPSTESSFAMPGLGGVPEQWEPEVTAMDSSRDESDF
ncbi:MAG: hypothetical protein KF861_24235 [Planctomycetaceae bacterium]|nr:hypothetical protein [Planctomycetaceae bacterium]